MANIDPRAQAAAAAARARGDYKAASSILKNGETSIYRNGVPATTTNTPKTTTTMAVSTDGGGGASYGSYNNGGLTSGQVAEMQGYYGTPADGKWGANSTAAAGGMDAASAWNNYQSSKQTAQPQIDLSEYLRQQAAAQLESELANLKSAYENNLAKYDEQARNLPAQFEQARNNAAAQEAIARRSFNERAVAGGLNTGTAGQSALARSSAYQNALAEIDRQQAQALADIEAAKADLRVQYENAIAAAKANGDAALANNLYNELVRVQNANAGSTFAVNTAVQSSAGAKITGSTGGGYNNQGVSADAVKQMQRALGMPESQVDGKWGAQTQAAYEDAGYSGKGAADAWNTYVRETKYLEALRR